MYEGICYVCGKTVEIDNGYFERDGKGGWQTRHTYCFKEKNPAHQDSNREETELVKGTGDPLKALKELHRIQTEAYNDDRADTIKNDLKNWAMSLVPETREADCSENEHMECTPTCGWNAARAKMIKNLNEADLEKIVETILGRIS